MREGQGSKSERVGSHSEAVSKPDLNGHSAEMARKQETALKRRPSNMAEHTKGDTISTKSPPGRYGLTAEPMKDPEGNPYQPGTGPLPPGASDGFDPNIILDGETGKLAYKTDEQKRATKVMRKEPPPSEMLRIYTDGSSLKNGYAGAVAGIGVWFGPGDSRYE